MLEIDGRDELERMLPVHRLSMWNRKIESKKVEWIGTVFNMSRQGKSGVFEHSLGKILIDV